MAGILLFISCNSATKAVASNDVLKDQAQGKVRSMQELIKFNDYQAQKLIELEYKYLVDIQEAENCIFCNKEKRIEKLNEERRINLQKYLPRDEYIKYLSTENNLLNENNRLWAE